MAKYPVFLELKDRRTVLIGSGAVAVRKAEALLEAGARLVVISKELDETMVTLCAGKNAELVKDTYSKQYITEAVLVIAATNDNKLNRKIYHDCQKLEILCNVVDNPELCDFYVPAVVKRKDLQIAISTAGLCPAYAGHIRKKIESIITQEHGDFLEQLGYFRQFIYDNISDPAQRTTALGKLVSDESFNYYLHNGPEPWRQWALNTLKEPIESNSASQ